jgi:alanine dehydrogenase
MKIGCVKEIKTQEYRVGLVPMHVKSYLQAGHTVLIETLAGSGSGFSDDDYKNAGALIVEKASDVWAQSDMIVKVKEPLEAEYPLMKEGLILYTYLHLAANEKLTLELMKRKVTGIAYETIEVNGALPLLKPMSEVAGRLSVQEAAKYLEKPFGGRGVLLGGVPGVTKGYVVIVGGGTVGTNAAIMALGMGARVSILDTNLIRLEELDQLFEGKIQTLYSTPAILHEELTKADAVIGAVLIPGAKAPHLIKREDLKLMKKGAVMVDVAVDQGGCFETTHPTTHNNPTFEVDGIVHYCVANMPGAVPYTSTLALTNATLKFALLLANNTLEGAIAKNKAVLSGINTFNGKCTNQFVAEAFNMSYTPFEQAH